MPKGSPYSADFRERVFKLRSQGHSLAEVSKMMGVAAQTIANWERRARAGDMRWDTASGSGLAFDVQEHMPPPRHYDFLTQDPLKARNNFAYFRTRYMDRRVVPWQTIAAKQVVSWLNSDQTEYVVMNVPPGAGKTTFWTDLMCWLIVRNRNIRILFGSRTRPLAIQPVNRVKKMLTRTRPLAGAEACLAKDYGRFKPELQDVWRREEFTVMTVDQQPVEDKEATLTAYGMESEFLGHRGDLVIWDDLVVGSTLRNIEQVEAQRKWWEEEGTTRVEPGGCLVLNGQRMGPNDLYRYSLDQKLEDTEESRWRHVVYPAHFDDECKEHHDWERKPDRKTGVMKKVPGTEPKPWPEGCLLDPERIPWVGPSGLMTIRRNREEKYRIQYQQEETDPDNVLVQAIWIDGGKTKDGLEFPGCWDNHRTLCEAPRGLSLPVYSIATADPSPTKFWAVQWWLYHPASEQRFLMNMFRGAMDAPDFLDWNENSKRHFGLMEDWQQMSVELTWPITHWIVEANAAQKFLMQYDHVERWVRKNRVQLISHTTTGLNKSDPEYGIQSIANRYRFGNVRLPRKAREGQMVMEQRVVNYLVKEATTYPDSPTDDCLMAQWFLEFNLPHLAKPAVPKRFAPRPKWMRTGASV